MKDTKFGNFGTDLKELGTDLHRFSRPPGARNLCVKSPWLVDDSSWASLSMRQPERAFGLLGEIPVFALSTNCLGAEVHLNELSFLGKSVRNRKFDYEDSRKDDD